MTNEIKPGTSGEIAPAPIQELMGMAISQGEAGVAALERLVELQAKMDDRAARKAYAEAMSRARAEFPEIEKTYSGAHTSRKGTITVGNYAPLHKIAEAIDPVLARHGLSYRWDREKVDGEDFIVCVVSHSEGHSERTKFPAILDDGGKKNRIQQIASGETYGKRYSLMGALGLTTVDPDDDAQRAGPRETVTDEQAVQILECLDVIEDDGYTKRFLAWANAPDAYSVPADMFGEAMRALRATMKKAGKA